MPITNNHLIDWSAFEKYLRRQIDEIPNAPMEIKRFTEGYSNLTYLVTIGGWQAVLRRPPFGDIPPKAHDMEREYTLLSKINPVYPLAPKPYLYNEDPKIMDKHFYVMEKKAGVVLDDEIPESFPKNEKTGQQISNAFVQSIVKLQDIDIYKHSLDSIGKPDAYLSRQVHGWIKRYNQSKTDEISHISEVEEWLVKYIPESESTTIVHNDFKLNNMMFDEKNPNKIVGVFDWELATVGDPLTEFGSALAYWADSSDPDIGVNIVTDQPGFYSRRELLQKYAELSDQDVTNMNYYLAFGFYKLAGILQQIYYRWKSGELEDDRFSALNISIANLIVLAIDAKNNKLL